MIFFVYKLTFLNSKVYIGISRTDAKGTFTHRYRQHAYTARSGKSSPIYNAWRKYGQPVQEILAVFKTREECAVSEIAFIKQHNSIDIEFGYNLTNGGEGLNVTKDSPIYHLMMEKVWNNPERKRKVSEALKGRPISEATKEGCLKYRNTPKYLDDLRRGWGNKERRKKASISARNQMANGGSDHLSKIFTGRADIRSIEGKESQRIKIKALMNTERGKEIVKSGYAAFAANPENIVANQKALNVWRNSDKNKENCAEMAKKSKEACSIKVMDLITKIVYSSQRDMAKALNLSDAAISKRVKSGKVIRI